MTKPLVFNIERQGFPIKFGEIDFFFGTSQEELVRFFDLKKTFEKDLEKLHEERRAIEISEESSSKEVNKTIEINKKILALEYDSVLGEGTFDKIYSKYPDIETLEEMHEPFAEAVAERLNLITEKKKKETEEKKKLILAKKNNKGK